MAYDSDLPSKLYVDWRLLALNTPDDALGGYGADPQFVCRTSDVSSAAEGDALVTGSVNYTVRDVIDDGMGMTTLMLEAD